MVVEVGSRVLRLRQAGLSRLKLAHALNLPTKWVAALERGEPVEVSDAKAPVIEKRLKELEAKL